MKNSLLLLIAFLSIMSACSKHDTVTPSTDSTATDIKSNISTGKWTISLFRQKLEDKTATFSGVAFVFNANGSVTATDTKGNATTGSWSSTAAQPSYYGAPPAAATFTLTMAGSGNFAKINKSWDVNKATTATSIQLDNKEPLEDEHLTFVK
jgi:myosin-crossreactive antigen